MGPVARDDLLVDETVDVDVRLDRGADDPRPGDPFTRRPPIERAFGGLDRVAVWHKRVATTAVLLLVPHVALVTSAPDPYETSLGHGLGDVALAGLLVLTVWALAPGGISNLLLAAAWEPTRVVTSSLEQNRMPTLLRSSAGVPLGV